MSANNYTPTNDELEAHYALVLDDHVRLPTADECERWNGLTDGERFQLLSKANREDRCIHEVVAEYWPRRDAAATALLMAIFSND